MNDSLQTVELCYNIGKFERCRQVLLESPLALFFFMPVPLLLSIIDE